MSCPLPLLVARRDGPAEVAGTPARVPAALFAALAFLNHRLAVCLANLCVRSPGSIVSCRQAQVLGVLVADSGADGAAVAVCGP